MAVAFDTINTFSDTGTAGPHVKSHTCSGSDRLLVVCIQFYHTASVVSALTYNGVALTKLGSFSDFNYNSEIWYLVAPATGANDVSLTFSGVTFGFAYSSISFTGVDQTTPMAGYASNSGTSTTPTVDVSSAADQVVIDSLCITHSGTLSVGASQTERSNGIVTSGVLKAGVSTETGASTTTMSWSNSTSEGWVTSAAAVLPSSGAPSGQPSSKRGAGTPYMNSSFSPRIW